MHAWRKPSLIALCLGLLAAGCNQEQPSIRAGAATGGSAAGKAGGGNLDSGADATGTSSSKASPGKGGTSGKGSKATEKEEGVTSDDETTNADTTSGDAPVDAGTAATEPAVIDYPLLTMRGNGSTKCDDSLATTTQVETQASATELRVTRAALEIQCYEGGFLGIGACDQEEFNQKVRGEALGETVYSRATAEEAKAAKGAGVAIESFLVFATRVVTHKGLVFVFDKPVPIFPWPSSLSKFETLAKGPLTYTASFSGAGTGTISIQVEKVSVSGDVFTVRLTSTINGGTNHVDYDKFPIPRQATYDVDTKNKDIRKMVSIDWFTDKRCPQDGAVDMTYRLCRKATSAKSEDFPCP